MKLSVSISILLIVSFALPATPAVAEDTNSPPADANTQQAIRLEGAAGKEIADANSIADANVAADANAVADVNVVADANIMKVFRGLEKALERVDKSSRNEIREWMRSRLERRITLVKAVQERRDEEFGLLRKLAVEEGAVRTVEAIDHLLAARRERYEDVIRRTEQERKKLLRREREEKDRERTERGRDQRRRGRKRRD